MGWRLFYFFGFWWCCFPSPAWDGVTGCCRGSGKASKTAAVHPGVEQDLLQRRPVRGVLGQTPADQVLARWTGREGRKRRSVAEGARGARAVLPVLRAAPWPPDPPCPVRESGVAGRGRLLQPRVPP